MLKMGISMALAMKVLDQLLKEFPLDSRRLYLTGLSMGGYGTWDAATRWPERFAAAVPVCGGGDETLAGKLAKLPVWAFHGDMDKAVPVQYLPDDLTRALLLRAGVDRDRLHLVYATGDVLPNDEILSTSMVVYVLEKFGVENIRIVDGGLAEWKKQGFAATQDYFGNPKGKLPRKGNPGVAATVADVQRHVGKPGNLLVDARPLNEFRGEDDVWLRKGHIPGAISFHWARLMEKENTHKFRPFSETKAALEAAGITPDKDIICYCGTSREGSLLFFYLKHVAGYPKVRLYEGAWKEYVWLNGKSLPAETGGKAAGSP